VVAGPGFGPISGILARNGPLFGIGGFEPPQPPLMTQSGHPWLNETMGARWQGFFIAMVVGSIPPLRCTLLAPLLAMKASRSPPLSRSGRATPVPVTLSAHVFSGIAKLDLFQSD
jgi:hypothetical protein